METVSVDVSVTLGINGPRMTVSMEDIGVVSTVYTLRQLVLPTEETYMQRISIYVHSIQVGRHAVKGILFDLLQEN